jgi:pimeloyl-ACP methyl ester carboxylesterase
VTTQITYGVLKAANPSAYSTAAAALQTVIDGFEQAIVDVNQHVYQQLRNSWSGQAATAAIASIGSTVSDYQATLDYLARFHGLLVSAYEGISDAQAYLKAAEAIAASNGWQMDADGQARPAAASAVHNRSLVQQLWQSMQQNPEYAEMVDMISRALSMAQAVNDQISQAMDDPEQYGRGKNWRADAAAAQSSATALEAKLERTLIPANGTNPAEVLAWWMAMSPATQVQLVKDEPGLIGALNGLPSMVRDKANRIVLANDIAADQAKVASLTIEEEQLKAEIAERLNANVPARGPIAVELQNKLQSVESELNASQSQLAGLSSLQSQLQATTTRWGQSQKQTTLPPLYLLGFDTNASGHAIVACGNPDTAKNVAVYVPGLGTSSNSTHFYFDVQHTENMTMQADQDTGADSNSTILWLGYNSPQISPSEHALDVAGTQDATDAVPKLTSFLSSVHTLNKDLGNLTLVGHSYGSLVVGETARASTLPVNNIVLLGSPGVSVNRASQLNISPNHVWAGAASGDPVARLGRFGISPTSSDFGGHVIDVDSAGVGMGAHGEYFDTYGNANGNPGRSSLDNIASIMTGQYNNVTYGDPTGDGLISGAEQGIINSGF